jgi:hypothetical protein
MMTSEEVCSIMERAANGGYSRLQAKVEITRLCEEILEIYEMGDYIVEENAERVMKEIKELRKWKNDLSKMINNDKLQSS